MKRSMVRAWLNELYAQVPTIKCKGHCKDSCGPIEIHDEERRAIREKGVIIPDHAIQLQQWRKEGTPLDCPALSTEGRCTVYEVRPMICRIWGVTEDIRCPWGCEVQGEILTANRGRAIYYHVLSEGRSSIDEIEAALSSSKIQSSEIEEWGAYNPAQTTASVRAAQRAKLNTAVLGIGAGLAPILNEVIAKKKKKGGKK